MKRKRLWRETNFKTIILPNEIKKVSLRNSPFYFFSQIQTLYKISRTQILTKPVVISVFSKK